MSDGQKEEGDLKDPGSPTKEQKAAMEAAMIEERLKNQLARKKMKEFIRATCILMDETKIKREQKLIDARNSIIEFINNTELDKSLITNDIKKRMIETVDKVYSDHEMQGLLDKIEMKNVCIDSKNKFLSEYEK